MDDTIVKIWERQPYLTNQQIANHPEVRCSAGRVSKALRGVGINQHLRALAKRRDRIWRHVTDGNASILTAVMVAAKLQRLGWSQADIHNHLGITWIQWLSFRHMFAKELGYA